MTDSPRRPSVLVVDDEPTIRALIHAALEPAGYRLLEAGNGPEALDLARAGRPDAILLDVALPGLSGTALCQRLRQEPATARTPVLLMTGIAPQAEAEVIAAGAQGVLAKPFTPATLLRQLHAVLTASGAA